MKRCPICGYNLLVYEWFKESLYQCKRCRYTKHLRQGKLELVIGKWRKKIVVNKELKIYDKEIA
ncbi:unnamed protein product, partial [marine sediment metagenome]